MGRNGDEKERKGREQDDEARTSLSVRGPVDRSLTPAGALYQRFLLHRIEFFVTAPSGLSCNPFKSALAGHHITALHLHLRIALGSKHSTCDSSRH